MNPQKVTVFLLALIAAGLIALALDFAQPVLMPLVIALLFSFVFAPAVERLHKLHMPRALAIIIIILIILGVFFLIGLFFYNSFQSFVQFLPKYQAKFQSIFNNVSVTLSDRFGLPTAVIDDLDWATMIRGSLINMTGNFIEFARGLFIVTLFLVFLLLERPYLAKKLQTAFAETTSNKIGFVIRHINQQIGKYLSVKLFISTITGVLIWLSLEIIGMDFPIVWGFAGFMFNFVPNIGSTLHFLIVSAMGFVQFYPESPGKIAAVVITMALIQNLIGNFFDPRLQGHRLDISPFLVLFSLIVWGWLWGAVGMLLATPIMVAVKIVCDNIPALNPIGLLMGKGFGRKKKQG
jgi:AI-2 transport protein TqsA